MRVPFSDPQANRTNPFHSAMLTAVEFFEFFLLLLALRQLQGVPWDYLLNELVFLRQLTPLLASQSAHGWHTGTGFLVATTQKFHTKRTV